MGRYIVPDSCALGAAFYHELDSLRAAPLLAAIRTGTVSAVAPAHGICEFLNICRKKNEGQGCVAVPSSDVDRIVAEFLSLPILWDDELDAMAQQSWNHYRACGMGTADAFFLQVASKWAAELWTNDGPFYAKALTIYPDVHDLKTASFA